MNDFERTRRFRTRILEHLESRSLDDALADLCSDKQVSRYQAARQRLEQDRMVVAVIGRQGIGKSTLGNALVGRRILPIDELETTNVICEVSTCDAGDERVEVHLRGGKVVTGPADEQWVGQFTDEQQNEGNSKGVERVNCFLHSPFLDSGITLADTPGVGSLTDHTARATYENHPDISLGLFLMGTSPTLLDSEATFLRATWGQAQSFIFVQNRWAHSQEEVDDGREDNLRKLQEISDDEGSAATPDLCVVDVHQALEGVANDWEDKLQGSGLNELVASVRGRLGRGAALSHLVVNTTEVLDALTSGHDAAVTRLAALADTTDDDEFFDRNSKAYDALDALGQEWRDTRANFSTRWRELLTGFQNDLEDEVQKAEDALVEMVEARKMKAKDVAAAGTQRLQRAASAPVSRLDHAFKAVIGDFVEKADEILESVKTTAKSTTRADSIAIPGGVGRTEAWESVGKGVMGVGSAGLLTCAGVAGYAAVGVIVAGEGAAAALAAAGTAVPGVGWAVAGVALLAGYGLKKAQERKAVLALVRAIHKAATDTRLKTLREARSAVSRTAGEVDINLDDQLRAAMEQQRETLERLHDDRRKSADDKEATRQRLQASIMTLSACREQVSAELQSAMQQIGR